MQDIIKVLTGTWAMTDVWAHDILIKATIRARHIMTNFPHLKPTEYHLLTQYVNRVACTSLAAGMTGMEISGNTGGPTWEDITLTNRWLKLMSPIYWQITPSFTLYVSNNAMIFAGHAALLFQTRPHAPSVSGFQGNWRPPACSTELCSVVKAGQTPLLSCQ